MTLARFELINAVGWDPGHPACPTGDGRFDGIIGLSARSAPDLDNPLWSFGPLGRTFSVHIDPAGPSSLVLGAAADGFTLDKLRPDAAPTDGGGGRAPSWLSNTPICFTATVFTTRICTPTVVDTGTPSLANLHPRSRRPRATPRPRVPDHAHHPRRPMVGDLHHQAWPVGHRRSPTPRCGSGGCQRGRVCRCSPAPTSAPT